MFLMTGRWQVRICASFVHPDLLQNLTLTNAKEKKHNCSGLLCHKLGLAQVFNVLFFMTLSYFQHATSGGSNNRHRAIFQNERNDQVHAPERTYHGSPIAILRFQQLAPQALLSQALCQPGHQLIVRLGRRSSRSELAG